MKKNSNISIFAICLYVILTIPLDRAALKAADIIADRNLGQNWFFGLRYTIQAAIIAIIPAIFGYMLFRHIEELKQDPTNELVVTKAVFASMFTIWFLVAGCDFVSLTAEGHGLLNTDTTANLITSSLIIGLCEGLLMACVAGTISCVQLKKMQRKLIEKADKA